MRNINKTLEKVCENLAFEYVLNTKIFFLVFSCVLRNQKTEKIIQSKPFLKRLNIVLEQERASKVKRSDTQTNLIKKKKRNFSSTRI